MALVAYAVLAAVGVVSAGSASAGNRAGYGADADGGYGDGYGGYGAASGDEDDEHGSFYELEPALVDGRLVGYYEFGVDTPLTAEGTVSIAPIWVFIDGFDADGEPRMIPDHPALLDVVPGDEGYSDLWDVQFVLVPGGFDSRAIRSLAALEASGFEIIPAGMLVNCPLVPVDATSAEGHDTHPAWYRGELVHYFDLGLTTTAVGAEYEFVTADGEAAATTPLLVLPDASEPRAQFLRLYLVTVPEDSAPATVATVEEIQAQGWPLYDTGLLVNGPIVD